MQEATAEQDLLDIIRLQPRFGEHSRLASEYVELFGVPLRLKPKKYLRLLMEVAALFEKKQFEHQKRTYAVTLPNIVEGLKRMCNKRWPEPIESHTYLKKVLITIVQTEQTQELAKRERYLAAREKGAPREPEVKDQRSDVREEQTGKRISDWIREEKFMKAMP
jgi:hypothetical protein